MKTEKQLAAVVSALSPEVERQIGNRSKTSVSAEGLTLMISFEAEDTIALRAAVNAYLRWINSTIGVLEVAEENDKRLSTV